jgi:hypothetical protein
MLKARRGRYRLHFDEAGPGGDATRLPALAFGVVPAMPTGVGGRMEALILDAGDWP